MTERADLPLPLPGTFVTWNGRRYEIDRLGCAVDSPAGCRHGEAACAAWELHRTAAGWKRRYRSLTVCIPGDKARPVKEDDDHPPA